jgi:hypothetical protein
MEYIVSAIWILLEMFSLLFTCKAFLHQRRNNAQTSFLILVASFLIFCIANLNIPPFYNYPTIQKISSFALCFLISIVAFKGVWYAYLIIIPIYYFSLGIVDTLIIYGTAALLKITVSELIWMKWLYTVVVSAGKCVVLFISWSLYYSQDRRKNKSLNNKRWLLTALFPIISIVMLYIIFDSYKLQGDLSVSAVVFSVILGVSNIAIIYLMTSLERTAKAEQNVAILKQSMALQTENIKALEKSYRAQMAATHEFKHQLQVIFDLLSNGDSSKAKEYISQLQVTLTSRIFVANTNHAIVDAILNEKYHLAKDNQIDISYKVNDLSGLNISTNAIVVLLSNLLDNAIEACQKIEDNRAIECTILLKDELFISVRNTALPVCIVNGQIETTKTPKAEHGYGLPGVTRVLMQLKAEYAIECSNGWFQFVAEIPN